MKCSLFGGSHDGEVIDVAIDSTGNFPSFLDFLERQTLAEGSQRLHSDDHLSPKQIERYVATAVGINDDGSTKIIYICR
ncbi:TPA: hypothetical protein K8M71_004433 [Citrobacter freundii]|nr:hypothetical protein [Citrobacter freundii]